MSEWIPLVLSALALLAAGYAAGRGWHRAALGLLGIAAGAGGWAAGRASAPGVEDAPQRDDVGGLVEETHPDAPAPELLPIPIPHYIEEADDEARRADPRRTGDADYADAFVDGARADGVID